MRIVWGEHVQFQPFALSIKPILREKNQTLKYSTYSFADFFPSTVMSIVRSSPNIKANQKEERLPKWNAAWLIFKCNERKEEGNNVRAEIALVVRFSFLGSIMISSDGKQSQMLERTTSFHRFLIVWLHSIKNFCRTKQRLACPYLRHERGSRARPSSITIDESSKFTSSAHRSDSLDCRLFPRLNSLGSAKR